MKRKTHEEYVKEVKEKNPNVEVIDEYINANTKILHKCLTHNIEWKIKPSQVLYGQGCCYCRIEKRADKQRKTHEQYMEELKIKNSTIVPIEKYINAKTPILHKCVKHLIQIEIAPTQVLEGYQCIECQKERNQKKFNEQYINNLKARNLNIVPLEKYIDTKTKISHQCLDCNYIWNARPATLLNNGGCPRCSQRFRRTHDDYVYDLSLKNPDIDVIEQYQGMSVPIIHYCKKHKISWKVAPNNILYQCCGCVECGKEKISEKLIKSHEQYICELTNKHHNIKALERYNGALTPILHRCLIDGYEWKTSPSNILFGKGCPKCANNIKLTPQIYIDRVHKINENIDVLEDYIDGQTKILHRCKIHDYQWNVRPCSILHGTGCPTCGIEKQTNDRRKTQEQYEKELHTVNKNIIVIDNYISSCIPIKHKCLIDGNEWYGRPGNILHGQGCPKCKSSHGEKKVEKWLEEHNIEYNRQKIFNDCRDIKPLPFDFYLPKLNLCIEYDGEQHFKPSKFFGGEKAFKVRQKHDQIKNEYCKNNGISLLRIPYFKNIEEELNNFYLFNIVT